MIKRSADLKYPIICKFKDDARMLKKKAKSLNLIIPEPITWNQVIMAMKGNRVIVTPGCHVLVDDAEYFLQYLIQRSLKCDIDTIAITEKNELGHELDVHGDDVIVKYGGYKEGE